MYRNQDGIRKLNASSQNNAETERYLDPSDIKVSEEFKIEVFALRFVPAHYREGGFK